MKTGILLLPLLLLLLVPLTARADCMDIIRHAKKSMAVTQKNMRKLKKDDKDTVKGLLKDAKNLLKDARRLCGKDASFFDKTGGTSKALAAESLITSADLVIKAK